MIKQNEPLSMAESIEYISKNEEKGTEIKAFIKKFVNMNTKDAKELRKKLEALDLIKLKQEHIIKIIDFVPKNAEELNKICSDVSLNEDETKKIIDTVKEFE